MAFNTQRRLDLQQELLDFPAKFMSVEDRIAEYDIEISNTQEESELEHLKQQRHNHVMVLEGLRQHKLAKEAELAALP